MNELPPELIAMGIAHRAALEARQAEIIEKWQNNTINLADAAAALTNECGWSVEQAWDYLQKH